MPRVELLMGECLQMEDDPGRFHLPDARRNGRYAIFTRCLEFYMRTMWEPPLVAMTA